LIDHSDSKYWYPDKKKENKKKDYSIVASIKIMTMIAFIIALGEILQFLRLELSRVS